MNYFRDWSDRVKKEAQRSYLVLFHIFHGEVEPDAKARVARVRPDEEIVLKVRNVVNSAEIAALEAGVKDEVALLGPTGEVGRNDGDLVDVARELLVDHVRVAIWQKARQKTSSC